MHTSVPETHVIEAPAAFRRATLVAALALLGLELGLFVAAWRLQLQFDPGADRRAAALRIVIGTVLTFQAMTVAGLAWVMVAMSRTTLTFDATGLALSHPWRRWQASFDAVSRAWHRGGWLVIGPSTSARAWYVRSQPQDPCVAAFRQRLPAGVWLEGTSLRAHLARRVLPIAAGLGAAGALAVWGLLRLLDSLGTG